MPPVRIFSSIEEARNHLEGMPGRYRVAVADMFDEAVRIGEHSAKLYAPKRTRRLESAISSTPAHERVDYGVIDASVGVDPVDGYDEGSPDYPFFVNVGTGLFGPLSDYIYAKRADVMVFVDRKFVVAKRVRGQRPQPYMDDAFEDVDSYLDARIDLMVDRTIDG